MAIFTTILQKFLQTISSTQGGFSKLADNEWFPLANAILVGVALIVIYLLYRQAKHEQRTEKTSKAGESSDIQAEDNEPVTDLAWVNQIFSWLFLSAQGNIPVLVDAWLQDLNIALANQQNRFGILIYGLREGTNPPLIKSVKDIKISKYLVEGKVLLQTSDFGFYVTVQENEQDKIIASSNYSAIVSQFQCWFAMSLSLRSGNYVLTLTPDEKRPIFSFTMKPLTKQTLASTAPEVIAEALKSSVLRTTYSANITTWCPYRDGSHDDSEFEDVEEQSCFGSDDEVTKDPKPRTTERSYSDGLIIDVPPSFSKMRRECISNSVPGSRSSTPLSSSNRLKDFESSSKVLSGSLGSLSSITRTPSGRGPAKPIRVREKRLLVRVLKLETPSAPSESLVCHVALNLPKQSRESTLARSQDMPMTFDLGSRSSQMDINVTSFAKTVGSGVIFLDTVDLEKSSQTSLPLQKDGKSVGSMVVEFSVMENYNGSKSNSLKRNSVSTMEGSSLVQELFSTPQGKLQGKTGPDISGDKEEATKVTTVTTATSVKRSPSRPSKLDAVKPDVTKPEKPDMDEVTFSPKSVAEAALQDLSSRGKTGMVKKTRIVITSIEKEDPDLTTNGDVSSSSSEHLQPSTSEEVTAFTGSESSPEKEKPERRNSDAAPSSRFTPATSESPVSFRNSAHLRPEAKVRRTRSLIFGKKKKKNPDIRSSLVIDNDQSDAVASLQLPNSGGGGTGSGGGMKKKSTSMSKLFGSFGSGKSKQKKRLKQQQKDREQDDQSLEVVLENGSRASGDSPNLAASAKPRRATSFRRLVGRKDKASSPKQT